ncbi:MAG: TraR/DksA C4-type zinc finger protein [Chitinophagaceae bacterium]|nr:TraR/DksA C4-type zinc finger protein [Chitinophagaceae bacterium]
MATNKKTTKKAPVSKSKPAKTASSKAAKVAPKKAAKPAKPAKSIAQKPAAKKAAKKAEVRKAAPAKTPVKSAEAAKKQVKTSTHNTAQKPVKKTAHETLSKHAAPKPEPVKKAEKPKEIKPVVLPKLSTSKARKYEPEFTQSILDQPEARSGTPTMKYSDTELQEFKELILRKLEAAKKELNYLQGLITRKDDMGGDESENRYMTMEDGSISMEREQLSQMASRQIQYIDHLEKALVRIENKTYGICRVTGKLIDKARLRAVPHATLSIEAKMGFARNPNIQ